DEASASVHLPGGIHKEDINVIGFTGPSGSTEGAYESSIRDDGSVEFKTTRRLHSYEGFTIAVSFPKGFVREVPREVYTPPPPPPRRDYLLLLGVAILFAYNL